MLIAFLCISIIFSYIFYSLLLLFPAIQFITSYSISYCFFVSSSTSVKSIFKFLLITNVYLFLSLILSISSLYSFGNSSYYPISNSFFSVNLILCSISTIVLLTLIFSYNIYSFCTLLYLQSYSPILFPHYTILNSLFFILYTLLS